MSDFTYTKTINTEGLPEEQIFRKLKQNLSQKLHFVTVKKDKKNGGYKIHGRVRTKILNPVVSLVGKATLTGDSNEKRLVLDAKSATNWFTWFTVMCCIPFPPLAIVLFFMYRSQKEKTQEDVRVALNNFKNDLD